MPCCIAIVRWGACQHSMLLRVGCTANCGDEDICDPQDQQTMVVTRFRWFCEDCHMRRAVTDCDTRADGWDARVAAVQARGRLTPGERNLRTQALRAREDAEERQQEEKRSEQVEEIQFAADWTYEYGLAAFKIRYGIAQKEAGDEEEQPEDEQQFKKPQLPKVEQQFKVPQLPKVEHQFKKPQLPKESQQFKEQQPNEEDEQFKEQQPTEEDEQFKEQQPTEEEEPEDEEQYELPQLPEDEEQYEEQEPDDYEDPPRRPPVNRDNAPEDRIRMLRGMLPWDLNVILDVLRTKQEVLKALNAQQRRGSGQTGTTSSSTGNARPSTPRA
ncbi:Uncharacterized protein TPAR_03062 [Tolypocladium paradoxum]|uniref:Uncharacterized protein n=1 Tax=Tolypocladium paradoxum TaxID=94208 RepID=A0A2S4L2X4_9HYPO|nr:Uncharacterized protein TPAR_03062 [Tolypocladium paradoxum]